MKKIFDFFGFFASVGKTERWVSTWWNPSEGKWSWRELERAMLLLRIQGKSNYRAPGKSPALSLHIWTLILPRVWLFCPLCLRASWGMAVSLDPGQAARPFQRLNARALGPTEWELVQRALWLSFASFPWKSCAVEKTMMWSQTRPGHN